MERNIMIIMNATAGKRNNTGNTLLTICNHFCAMKDHIQVYLTQYAHHAKELCTLYAQDFDILLCIGGDGTWNEVVNGIMPLERKPHLCYLPSGTINDFANSLHLPKDAHKLMKQLEHATLFACDIGRFNRRYFTYVAAFGIFTEISYSTPQSSKNVFGRVAYFLEGFKQLTKIPHYHVRVESKELQVEDEFMFGCISNSKYVAGFPSVNSDDAQLDDGLFEVLLIRKPNNPLDVQTIIASLMKHEVNANWMYFCKTTSITLTSDVRIPWTLDGEDGGTTAQTKVINKHKAITMLI